MTGFVKKPIRDTNAQRQLALDFNQAELVHQKKFHVNGSCGRDWSLFKLCLLLVPQLALIPGCYAESFTHISGSVTDSSGTRDPAAGGNDPIDRLRGGDRSALAKLFDEHRDRLRRMLELRIDARLQARLDASDVLQKAFLDGANDLDDDLADPRLSPNLWLRPHLGRRLTTLHRKHLGTKMRDAGLEISLYQRALPGAGTAALAWMLRGRNTSPPQAAQRAERLLRLQQARNRLEPIDREVLALRHFEQLGRTETARLLGISQQTGAKRYFRALKRLKDALATLPGGWEGL